MDYLINIFKQRFSGLFQQNAGSPLKETVLTSNHDQELYAFLSKADDDISKIDQFGWTPIHRAI